MMMGRRRPRRDENSQAAEMLGAATAMMHAYLRAGITVVPVADVLELLGAAPPPPEAEAAPPPRDPRADPVTGILWAGPAGSLPPR